MKTISVHPFPECSTCLNRLIPASFDCAMCKKASNYEPEVKGEPEEIEELTISEFADLFGDSHE